MEENYTQVYERPSKSFAGFIDILESFIYAIVVVVLVFTFLGRLSVVDGSSMDNTLSHGEYLVVADPFFLYQPKQGDIVIIDGGEAFTPYTEPIVKRVIATAGQTITIDTKAECVYVDGVMLEEEYAKYELPPHTIYNSSKDYHDALYFTGVLMGGKEAYNTTTGTLTVTVPEDHVFVMGDNRLNSADSRVKQIGFVHKDYVVGKAVFRLFPFSSIGGLY
ncbi:MAG: signal peptidase I [Clostridia bacterium]|nr:signal peptidase I [Clostridia bacterium]